MSNVLVKCRRQIRSDTEFLKGDITNLQMEGGFSCLQYILQAAIYTQKGLCLVIKPITVRLCAYH